MGMQRKFAGNNHTLRLQSDMQHDAVASTASKTASTQKWTSDTFPN
jgi:hypothetical protein